MREPPRDTTPEPLLTSAALPGLVIIASRALPWLASGQAMRDLSRRAAREPLPGIFGWAMVAIGSAMLALSAGVLAPGIGSGVLAAEGWLVTTAGGPLVAVSTLIRHHRDGS